MGQSTPLTFAIQILESLPLIFSVGAQALTYINNNITALRQMQLENRDPSDAEWEALNKIVEDLRAARPDIT